MWVFGSSVGSTPARGRRRVRSRALRGGITLAFGRIFSNRLPRARVEKARGRTCSPRPSVVSEHKRSSSSRPLSSSYQRYFRSACAARHARWSPYSRRCWMTSGMSLRSRIRASGCLNQKQPGNSRIRDSARATSSFSDSPMLSGEDVATPSMRSNVNDSGPIGKTISRWRSFFRRLRCVASQCPAENGPRLDSGSRACSEGRGFLFG